MKRLDGLRSILKNIDSALNTSKSFMPEMSERQKEQWNLMINCFLEQARKNIKKLEQKAIAKGGEAL